MIGRMQAWPTGGQPIRGQDTTLGQPGYCLFCGMGMPDGPDACLGWIEGVAAACCGHGAFNSAYVVIGAEADADLAGRTDVEVRRGEEALAFFRERGVGPSL